jgi:hypothetical protein
MEGIYDKYTVIKNDGTGDPGADYFVLRLDTDKHARKAAIAYAESIQDENPNLAFDIRRRVAKYEGGLLNGD